MLSNLNKPTTNDKSWTTRLHVLFLYSPLVSKPTEENRHCPGVPKMGTIGTILLRGRKQSFFNMYRTPLGAASLHFVVYRLHGTLKTKRIEQRDAFTRLKQIKIEYGVEILAPTRLDGGCNTYQKVLVFLAVRVPQCHLHKQRWRDKTCCET